MLDRDLPPPVVAGCLGRLVVLDENADEHDDVVAVEEDANERCLYAVVLLGAPF